MRKKLAWIMLTLGAGLLTSCSLVMAPPPGDFHISIQGGVYAVNGMSRPEITLTRGMTYTFSVNTSSHPFYITTDGAGGFGAPGKVTVGVTGSPVDVGTLTFTPDASHVLQLYYQCAVHLNMGNKINLVP